MRAEDIVKLKVGEIIGKGHLIYIGEAESRLSKTGKKVRYIKVKCLGCGKEFEKQFGSAKLSNYCWDCGQKIAHEKSSITKAKKRTAYEKNSGYAIKRLTDYLSKNKISLTEFVKDMGIENINNESLQGILNVNATYSWIIYKYINNRIKKMQFTTHCFSVIQSNKGRPAEYIKCSKQTYNNYSACLTKTAIINWNGWEIVV